MFRFVVLIVVVLSSAHALDCYCQKGPSTHQELADNEDEFSGWTNCFLTGNNPSSGTCFDTSCPGGEWIKTNLYAPGEKYFQAADAADCISMCSAMGGDFNIANMPAHCGNRGGDDDYDDDWDCPGITHTVSKMASGSWMSFEDTMAKPCNRRASYNVTSFMTDARKAGKGMRLMFWITIDQYFRRIPNEFAVTVADKASKESHSLQVRAYGNGESMVDLCTSVVDPMPPHYGSYAIYNKNSDDMAMEMYVEVPVPPFSNWARGTYEVTIQPDQGNQCVKVRGMKPRRLRADGSVPPPAAPWDDDDHQSADYHSLWH